ncbi:MAG: hypothetical protein ACRBG0_05060 [Lewinella sp.]|uniref:hypothetical protein n=1 Tax=Lewinella sp. TaxID=2004506 RepID=UPI003D6C3BC3
MLADISFQHYVLSYVLGEKFSGRCYFLHLNKEYVRQGGINYRELLITDDVSEELMTHDHLEMMIEALKDMSPMDKETLDERYPYNGEDHLTYFGVPQAK